MGSLVSKVRSAVYKSFFCIDNPISTQWGYDKILESLPDGATILDVGCGDGIYFTNPEVLKKIRKKNLKIACIDIDAGAVKICNKRIKSARIDELVSATAISLTEVHEKYDYILFMESFPVMPIDLFTKLLQHALTLAKKKVMMYHNLAKDEGFGLSIKRTLKPLIKYITLVDFGRLTTITEMKAILKRSTDKDFLIEPLLKCKLSEMHFLVGWMEPFARLFTCGKVSTSVIQYLITIAMDPPPVVG